MNDLGRHRRVPFLFYCVSRAYSCRPRCVSRDTQVDDVIAKRAVNAHEHETSVKMAIKAHKTYFYSDYLVFILYVMFSDFLSGIVESVTILGEHVSLFMYLLHSYQNKKTKMAARGLQLARVFNSTTPLYAYDGMLLLVKAKMTSENVPKIWKLFKTLFPYKSVSTQLFVTMLVSF